MPKRRGIAALFGGVILLTMTFTLPAAASANAAVAAPRSVPAHSVTRSDSTVSRGVPTTVTIPQTVTCTAVTGLSHPGDTLYSYGYFYSCAGTGSYECEATVDLQEANVGGGWTTVVFGPSEYGCPPYSGISTITATCRSIPHEFEYRTVGIYVLSGGTVSTKRAYSPIITL